MICQAFTVCVRAQLCATMWLLHVLMEDDSQAETFLTPGSSTVSAADDDLIVKN